MADLPDPVSLKETPLVNANIPSIHLLAQRGELTSFTPLLSRHAISHKNALLSILGYDLDRGEPSAEELMEFGLDNSQQLSDYPTLRPFVIPGFSGHGICVTPSAWVRGVAKCALLKPVDIYTSGSNLTDLLETMASITTESIKAENEFALVYIDTPLRASLAGNFENKKMALEAIDRHLINPIADFVWKSDLMINMAVTTDLTTSWHTRQPSNIRSPAVVYFNNHDWEGIPERKFTEVQAMLATQNFYYPSDLIRYLCNFSSAEEASELPF